MTENQQQTGPSEADPAGTPSSEEKSPAQKEDVLQLSDFPKRKKLFSQIEKIRQAKVLAYITGDKRGMETKISKEVVDLFMDHLDQIGPTSKIALVLYTNGGDTAAAWRLINLFQTFCDELEVIIISKALSAGTLISLGANKIIMTKQAALGPIDPSLDNPLNPNVPGHPAHIKAPVSVEAVRGYLDAAREELKIKGSADLTRVLMHLADKVHPLVLGQIFRTHSQIRSLAKKLLPRQVTNKQKIEKIIDFLCAQSGSHDYTINRREAVELGLHIEKPSHEFYKMLRNLHKSYIQELGLLEPYDPYGILGGEKEKTYCFHRALIESSSFGCHGFVSEGKLHKETAVQQGATIEQVKDDRTFDGWRKLA